MEFIDICAGIGGFRSGLEKAGMKCTGYIEIDKFARKSYEAMYETEGEWTAYDVREVNPEDIPKSDLWCFGFPCQDISVAGKQKGLGGARSGIFYDIISLLKSQSPETKPGWLLIENVKNLLSISQGEGFTEVLTALDQAGYDAEWALLNSKDFGVPQNRERVFIIGHLRERGRREVLFTPESSGQTDTKVKPVIPGNQAHRVYDSGGLSVTVKAEGGGPGAKSGLYAVPEIKTIATGINQRECVQEHTGIARTLTATDYKEPQPVAIPCLTPDRLEKRQNGRRFKENNDPMFTLTAQDRHGVVVKGSNHKLVGKKISDSRNNCIHSWDFDLKGNCSEEEKKLLELILNNRRHKKFGKKDGNPLTPEQIKTFAELDNLEILLEHLTELGYLKKNNNHYDLNFGQLSFEISDILDPDKPVKTLTSTDCDRHGVMLYNGSEYNIRRLTPKECFRLQGFTDEQFEKAEAVNSNSQLYKQAGNAVTVNVAEYLGRLILQNG